MRLLHAAGALDRLLDRKLNDVLGALLECMRMTCDHVLALVELDSHPAALRFTAPAAAAQHHPLPAQQPATRPNHNARESQGQFVRQRLRQVASACQRPRAKASAPPATPQSAPDGRLPQLMHHARQIAPAAAHQQAEEERALMRKSALCSGRT
jgi:hypothetical protein